MSGARACEPAPASHFDTRRRAPRRGNCRSVSVILRPRVRETFAPGPQFGRKTPQADPARPMQPSLRRRQKGLHNADRRYGSDHHLVRRAARARRHRGSAARDPLMGLGELGRCLVAPDLAARRIRGGASRGPVRGGGVLYRPFLRREGRDPSLSDPVQAHRRGPAHRGLARRRRDGNAARHPHPGVQRRFRAAAPRDRVRERRRIRARLGARGARLSRAGQGRDER